MELSRYTELFLSEAREHFSSINRLLLGLESRPDDAAAVDELFRAVHTLKGMSGAMGFAGAAELSHALEHLLEALRARTLALDSTVVDLLLEATDALERAVEQEASGAAGAEPTAIVERLQQRAAAAGEGESVEGVMESDAPEVESDEWPELRVRVHFDPESVLPSVRAVMALRAARAIGSVAGVQPPEAQLMGGELDGPLSFSLRTEAAEAAVRAVVEAVGEVERVEVQAVARAGEPGERAGRGVVVRVRQERLDALVDQLGELVIARDRLERIAGRLADAELDESVTAVMRLVGDLREDVMRLRAVPVGEAFDRFPRLVRDAARALGKQVSFEMEGRDEELDRSLLNEVADLLVHLLRNAVDHGIEPPAQRLAAGKPEVGRVRLTAERTRMGVVVRVEDDGRGLRRDRIERTAVERGLVSAHEAAALSTEGVLRLISRPGFSTAEQVTDVSGRGVGLDVVSSRVQALGGAVEVESEPGRGTRFSIRLPLTLSIIRVLMVRAGDEMYALPVAAVMEVCEFSPAEVEREADTEYLSLRGERIPLVRLAEIVAARPADRSPAPVPAVVVDAGGAPLVLAVNALLGQREAVVKPFDATLQMTQVFSGATLLSDGRPCLILEPTRLAPAAAMAIPRNALS